VKKSDNKFFIIVYLFIFIIAKFIFLNKDIII